MNPTKYEQQLRWKQESLEQAKLAKRMEEEKSLAECTFNPTYYTQLKPVAEFEGPAKELNKVFGDLHVKRQQQGRLNKKTAEEKVVWQANKKSRIMAAYNSNAPSTTYESTPSKERKPMNRINSMQSTVSADSLNVNLNNISRRVNQSPTTKEDLFSIPETKSKQSSSGLQSDDETNDIELDDFTLIKLLESERKEWANERMKLINCIHLQQMELSQRATAAQSRAGDIAKEFARTIEGFEQRIESVETNVQKEILLIKNITENLKSDIIAAITNQYAKGVKSPEADTKRPAMAAAPSVTSNNQAAPTNNAPAETIVKKNSTVNNNGGNSN